MKRIILLAIITVVWGVLSGANPGGGTPDMPYICYGQEIVTHYGPIHK